MDSGHSLKRTPQNAPRWEVMGGAFKRRDIAIRRKGREEIVRRGRQHPWREQPSIREIAKKEKEVGAGFAVATGTAKVTKLRAQRVRSAWLPWRRCEACEWETGTGNLARLMTNRPGKQ